MGTRLSWQHPSILVNIHQVCLMPLLLCVHVSQRKSPYCDCMRMLACMSCTNSPPDQHSPGKRLCQPYHPIHRYQDYLSVQPFSQAKDLCPSFSWVWIVQYSARSILVVSWKRWVEPLRKGERGVLNVSFWCIPRFGYQCNLSNWHDVVFAIWLPLSYDGSDRCFLGNWSCVDLPWIWK